MRYFLIIFGICIVAVMGIAGKRGAISRQPPLYVFPDMKRQLKLRPQEPNGFFANGTSSQSIPAGTVARTRPLLVAGNEVYPYDNSPVFTGRAAGTTNFVETNPLPVTAELLKRGEQRFNIFCLPCHGAVGDGNGIVKKVAPLMAVANLQDPRIVKLADGELFHVITSGRNTMGAYGPSIPVEDRWAIIAYLRALQLSRLGALQDLPPAMQENLRK
jgi:cytochrome c5